MAPTEKVQIENFEYEIQKMPPRQGLRTAARLVNLLAPSVAKLPAEGFKIESAEQLAGILTPLMANPELGNALDEMCEVFIPLSRVRDLNALPGPNGQVPGTVPLAGIFDLHFADRYDALLVWLYQSIRLSMSSFLRKGGALAGLSQLAAVFASKSPSSPEKTGPSGG